MLLVSYELRENSVLQNRLYLPFFAPCMYNTTFCLNFSHINNLNIIYLDSILAFLRSADFLNIEL